MKVNLIIAACVLIPAVLTTIVLRIRERRREAAYKAATQPCIVAGCENRVPKKYDFTDVFCPAHWSQVPQNLKRGLAAEAATCRRAGRATNSFTLLLNSAVRSLRETER